MPRRRTALNTFTIARKAEQFKTGGKPKGVHNPPWLNSAYVKPSHFSVVDHLIQQHIHRQGAGLRFVRKRDHTQSINGMNVTVGRVYPLWNPETKKIVGKIDFPHEHAGIRLFVADEKAIVWEKFRQGLEKLLETSVFRTTVDPDPDIGVGR